VDQDGHRLADGLPLAPAVAEVADELLLLGVDGDDWLAGALHLGDLGGDVVELGVAIGVAGARESLLCGLEAVSGGVEHLGDLLGADGEALPGQCISQLAHTLGGPAQGRLGVATRNRVDERVESGPEARSMDLEPLAATTRLADASVDLGSLAGLDLCDAGTNGRAGHADGGGDGRDAAATERQGFRRSPDPPGTLVEVGCENFQFFGDVLDLRHTPRKSRGAKTTKLFANGSLSLGEIFNGYIFSAMVLSRATKPP